MDIWGMEEETGKGMGWMDVVEKEAVTTLLGSEEVQDCQELTDAATS